MLKRLLKLQLAAGTLAVTLSLVVAGVASAGEPPSTEVAPKIEVQEDGWLVISFGGEVKDKQLAVQQLDAYLAEALSEMNASGAFAADSILGSNSMYASAQAPWGTSYVQGTFTTYASWTSSPASFSGTSTAAWYGPGDCSSIMTSHYLSFSGGTIQSYPSAQWYPGGTYTNSPQFTISNTWYFGTSWSGLTASYGGGTNTVYQQTTSAFYFSGSGPVVQPSNSMPYGF